MSEDSRIVDHARVEDIFTSTPDPLWSSVLERKGPQCQRLSKMPYDPSLN